VTSAERTVFIVESHAAVGDSMRALLESAGLHAEVYRSGSQFAAAFETGKPGCLVLNVDPSSLNAFELLDLLAARGIALPAILITWLNDAAIKTLATHPGVAAVLQKPLSDTVLLGAIERALRHA